MDTKTKKGENPNKEIKLNLKDAFGKDYFVWALPKEKIVQILDDIDMEKVVETAYRSMTPGLETGVAELDIRTGKIVGAGYSTGSGDIQGTHLISLFSVNQNIEFSTKELLSDKEISEREELWQKGEDLSDEEYLERIGEDIDEREIRTIYHDALNTGESTMHKEGGWMDQVNTIYLK